MAGTLQRTQTQRGREVCGYRLGDTLGEGTYGRCGALMNGSGSSRCSWCGLRRVKLAVDANHHAAAVKIIPRDRALSDTVSVCIFCLPCSGGNCSGADLGPRLADRT